MCNRSASCGRPIIMIETSTLTITTHPYGRQHITDEDIAAVTDVLRGPFLTQGPHIGEFETAFANYIGCQYAVAVANGTAALHLCCMALGVTAGTRVITTPITFSASANCVRYCGGEVYFADIDPGYRPTGYQCRANIVGTAP